MLQYETPITLDNWKQAEKAAIEVHERASRKKFQSRLIRSVSVYTVTLTILVAAYGILRRLGFRSFLFGNYESIGWLNSVWEAVFGHVYDLSGLWYIRWPLIALEVILIPAAISAVLALFTVRKKEYAPPLYRDDPRSRAMVLRDIVTWHEGFMKQVFICAIICTLAFIAFVVAENLLGDPGAPSVLAITYDDKTWIRYAVGVVVAFAGSGMIAALSSLVSKPFYYDNGRAATRMMSDLYDFIHSLPDEDKSKKPDGANVGSANATAEGKGKE